MNRSVSVGAGIGLSLIAVTGRTFAAEIAASADLATEPESPSIVERIRLGLRLGYALPMGTVEGDTVENGAVVHWGMPLRDVAIGLVPVWLDAGYMVTKNVLVGAYGQYGFGRTSFGMGCQFPGDCSATEMRVGAQGQYHFQPEAAVDPWLGLGAGYETLKVSNVSGGIDVASDYRCWEFANLQGGVDVDLAQAVTLGPFVSLSVGQCNRQTFSANGVEGTIHDVNPMGLHEWLTFGAKGTFGL